MRWGDGVGRGGGGGGGGGEGPTADTPRKRPERPWTAARTMEVLRRCPLAIAQRLVHCATAVSTAVLGDWESQGQCPLHCCWGTTRSERNTFSNSPCTFTPTVSLKSEVQPHPTAAVTPSNASVHSHLLHNTGNDTDDHSAISRPCSQQLQTSRRAKDVNTLEDYTTRYRQATTAHGGTHVENLLLVTPFQQALQNDGTGCRLKPYWGFP